MSTPDRYIPGVPCWADTNQPDPAAAAAFYSDLFGWEVQDMMPPDEPSQYFMARIDGEDVVAIGSQPDDAPPTPAWNTYVWVTDADETVAKAVAAGGRVLTEPFDVMTAGRMAVLADPEGAVFSVWQANDHRGSAVVNAHGAVNFNDLYVRDLDGAKAFYNAVFGWETLDLGDQLMWTLPGYGDHLDVLNPGTVDGMLEMGAPAGFQHVVASLSVIPDDQPDTPAHWGVTFGADDADAIVPKAKELGATVQAEPFDAEWVRMTVITDPQGATFTASQFVPPEH